MKKETIKTAPTVEAAVSAACEELGVKPEDVIYEVLTQPKRGFLGIGSVDAKVRVEYTVKPSSSADDFAKKLLEAIENLKIEYQGKVLQVTASLGFSFFLESDNDEEDVVKRADNGLYECKGAGGNTFFIV